MNAATPTKVLFIICALFVFTSRPACAQEVVLMDRNLKQPVKLVNTVTLGVLQNGYFPIYKSALDSTINVLEYILEKQVQQREFKYLNRPVEMEGTQVVGNLSRHAGTHIFLKTTVGTYTTFMDLVSGKEAPFQRERKLYQLLDYLKNNRPLVE